MISPLRFRVVAFLAAILLPSAVSLAGATPAPGAKPNVLLIILEDWGPYLGCYGQKMMRTPNLDQLAAEGCRYDACFSSAPVCSTGRSSLMTGMSQYTVHAEQHRTAAKEKMPLPPGVKTLPEIFRDAGYFTALGCGYSEKIDLNFAFPADKIYLGSDWRQRKPGQPFYAHLTLLGTHRPWKSDPARPIDPASVVLPPWYPDTPLTRKDWAMGLESAQNSDRLMGDIIARLKREGLYDNTVIVVTADHGVALPRGKQFLYDEGLHIVLMIRWPASVKAGTSSEELVSNLDIVPTILGMAGLPAPKYLQGRNILDPASPQRKLVFAGRDKMDATHDAMRAVRSKDFKYILNLMPERPYCQFNDYKERSYPGLAVLNVLHIDGKLPPEQDAFMQPCKPEEELFDLRKDPSEIKNVAGDPAYADVLASMRSELKKWRESVGDPGINDKFRNGGWPATYPTRPAVEWKQILFQWEEFILRKGPRPTINTPPGFAEEQDKPPAKKRKKAGRK